MKKNTLTLSLLYGFIYIWTGAIFMSILFRLFSFYDEKAVTFITEVFYYILQTAGCISYSLFIRSNPKLAGKRLVIVILLVLTLACGSISLLSADSITILIFGAFMNFFIGSATGTFLLRLTVDVPAGERGISFGINYALGSIGTFLISLPSGGNALTSGYILYVYLGMTAISVLLVFLLLKDTRDLSPAPSADALSGNKVQPPVPGAFRGIWLLLFLIPVIFMITFSMGYHFEQANAKEINIIFTRAFYAFSLLLAGFINDRSRKTGAICGFLALSFPLISLVLRNDAGFVWIASVMSYLFLGFLSVYRVVLFTDLAGSKSTRTPLCTFGIAGAVFGNAIGTTLGLALEPKQAVLACVTLLLFILCSFSFFIVFKYLYQSPEAKPMETEAERRERLFQEYVARYHFNSKQADVLRLLLEGNSNCEIAEKLFLAESTVKYHVKNILKTTGFTNRNELIDSYKDNSGSDMNA